MALIAVARKEGRSVFQKQKANSVKCLKKHETEAKTYLCVKLNTVCEITYCVQNYTGVPFASNVEKFLSHENFTLTL